MVIYGSKGSHFATLALPYTACPACRRTGQLQAALIGRYAHVYWIPLFPYQKLAVVQCNACGHSWSGPEIATQPALASAVAEVKQQARPPFWMWSGLGIAALLIGWGIVASVSNTRTDDKLLLAPRAGDIYSVHNDSTHTYSLLKVRQAEGNMVELVPNQYETDNDTPYTQLRDKPWASDSQSFTLTRLDLQIMRRKGEITDVDRP